MTNRIASALLTLVLMAVVIALPARAQFADQATFAGASGGTNAQTITLQNATSYADVAGVLVKFRPAAGNTSSPVTLNINSFGSSPEIKRPTASGLASLRVGDLVAAQDVVVMYDSVSCTCFVLISPPNTDISVGSANLQNSALGFGFAVNLQLNASVSTNALTIAVKGADGNDASATNPVLLPFRSSTIAAGSPKIVSLQAALSFTIASSNTMGCVSNQMCRLWIVAICSTGLECTGSAGSDVVALCAFNARSGTSIAPIDVAALQTSASGTSGGSSAQTYYCNVSAVTARAILILGYVDLLEVTAGTWASGPTYTQLFGPGVRKPGDTVQEIYQQTGAYNNGTTVMPFDDSIPQSSEGTQFMSQAIVPSALANVIHLTNQVMLSSSSAVRAGVAVFQDSNVNALSVTGCTIPAAGGQPTMCPVTYRASVSTTSSTTFKIIVGPASAATVYFNGDASARLFNGLADSFIWIREIMGALPEPANDDGSAALRMVG